MTASDLDRLRIRLLHTWTVIAAAQAKGLRTRLERFGGILSLQKNSEQNHQKLPKTIFLQRQFNRKPVMVKTKTNGKESLADNQ